MGTRFEKAVVSIVKETPAVQEAASEMATGASNQWLYMLCVYFFAFGTITPVPSQERSASLNKE